MEKITNTTTVSRTELALVIGKTGRRVSQLIEDGIIQSKNGRYLLCESVQNYIGYKTTDFADKSAMETELAKKRAEAKLKEAKAIIAELEAKELKGKMHRSEDVRAITEDLIYTIRTGMLALPGRLAVDTAAASTAAETADIIRREVFHLMKTLSEYQYDPAKYEERVRERMDWEEKEKELDDDE